MDAVVSFCDRHLKDIGINVSTHQGKQRACTIGAAVVLFGLCALFHDLTTAPRNIRHIPQIGFFTYLKTFFAGEPIEAVSRKVIMPVLTKAPQGIYARFDNTGWVVHVASPAPMKTLFLKTDLFPKVNLPEERKGTLNGRFAVGPNLVFLNGEQWKRQRKMANPAFHRSMPIDLFGTLTKTLFQLMETMGGPVYDIHDLMERYTLDAIGLAGFDFNFHALTDQNNEWLKYYSDFTAGVRKPIYSLFPFIERYFLWLLPNRRREHQELTKFLDMLDRVIIDKRQRLAEKKNDNIADADKDLLTLMLEESQNGPDGMTNEQLKSNLCIFFLAGHDTTSNALCYALYYLAMNPDIQEKARKEVIGVLGDKPQDVVPTADQIRDQMPYLNMVIKETLRIDCPVVSVAVRKAAKDTDLNGVFIPKGTRITADMYLMHHNPNVWDNPSKFDPERFAPNGEADQKSGGGMPWAPFGGGARQCIGMNFSLAEQRVLLSMFLRKFVVSLPEDSIHKKEVITQGIAIISPTNLKLVCKPRY